MKAIRQPRTLDTLRDTLLPKLLSGDVTIPQSPSTEYTYANTTS